MTKNLEFGRWERQNRTEHPSLLGSTNPCPIAQNANFGVGRAKIDGIWTVGERQNRPKSGCWMVREPTIDQNPKSRIWTVGAQRMLCHCRLKRPCSTTAAPPPHHFTTAASQSPRRSATRLHCRADLPLPLLCLLLPRRSATAYCLLLRAAQLRLRYCPLPTVAPPCYCRAAALAAPLRYCSAVSLLPSHFDRHCMLLPHCAAPRRSATGASLCYCRAAQCLSYSPPPLR